MPPNRGTGRNGITKTEISAHSLPRREVEPVEDVPYEEDGPHEAEHHAVEAQSHEHCQKQHVQGLPDFVGHLHFFVFDDNVSIRAISNGGGRAWR